MSPCSAKLNRSSLKDERIQPEERRNIVTLFTVGWGISTLTIAHQNFSVSWLDCYNGDQLCGLRAKLSSEYDDTFSYCPDIQMIQIQLRYNEITESRLLDFNAVYLANWYISMPTALFLLCPDSWRRGGSTSNWLGILSGYEESVETKAIGNWTLEVKTAS